jgi:hypothetical protein
MVKDEPEWDDRDTFKENNKFAARIAGILERHSNPWPAVYKAVVELHREVCFV